MTRREAFDDLYGASPDPWGLETRWYERRKHALTLAALPRERYHRAFEPGCSIGVLTALLAERCEVLLAADIAGRAVDLARARVADCDGVAVERLDLPREWPAGEFDLIVLSELGYFLDAAELDVLVERAEGSLVAGGDLVAVNWLGPVEGYPLDGRAVHARLERSDRLQRLSRYEEDAFQLDVYRR